MIAEFAPDHPSWRVLREEIGRRIERARDGLETNGLEAPQTEYLRGQIAALRRLIADVEEAPIEPTPTPGYV